MRTLPIAAATVTLLLVGCAGAGGQYAAQSQNAGPYPDNYREIARGWLRSALVDPHSVQDLTISEPHLGTMWLGLLNGGRAPGWATCVTFNAKNRLGGYTGLQTQVLWIVNEQLVGIEIDGGEYTC
jgi:hypothetical protein